MRPGKTNFGLATGLALGLLVRSGDIAAQPEQTPTTYDEGADPPEMGNNGNVEAEGDDPSLRVPCLQDLSSEGEVRKGVQQRPFLKRQRFEVAALGGLYASDVLSSTYTFGGAAAFYLSEDLAVEFMFTHAPVRFTLEEPFSAFDRERRFEPGRANQAIASIVFVPMQAKFKFSEESILPGDIFFVAGAGRTFHDSVQGITWEAGVGMHLYFGRYASMRLDVRDFILPQEVLGYGRITNNLMVTMGLGLWVL